MRALVGFALALVGAGCVASHDLCTRGRGDLACVGTRFDAMYDRSYDELWSILYGRAEAVAECEDEGTVRSFLGLVPHTGNAEFAEFYARTLETLALEEPRCLARAWMELPGESRGGVVRFLREPLFESAGEIAAAARQAEVPEAFPELASEMGW